jgi:hypothetical protein
MKKIFTICFSLLLKLTAIAGVQPGWKSISENQALEYGKRETNLVACNYYEMNPALMWTYLQDAPMERSGKAGLELSLPSAFGGLMKFVVVKSPVMAPELAAKYPMIETWAGQGIDDPTATIRLDITQWGFHAMIISPKGTEFIDPLNLQTSTIYISYQKKNAIRSGGEVQVCEFDPFQQENRIRQEEIKKDVALNRGASAPRSIGSTLKTYRLALACTGEYATFYGGTVSGALGGMVTSVNRVNQVFEKELCFRLNLVANTDTLIFLNPSTDPYTNSSGSTMLTQNHTQCNQRIGSSNYDIGHVFSTGGGGIAQLGCVCVSSGKGRGVTGSPSPVGDAFDIDYVAHEMGHQFGGNHTFNGTTGSCSGTINNQTAFEPGSGSTIMAYAGICNGQDVQSNSDDYFHTESFDEIQDYITFSNGNNCPIATPTGNNPPNILSTTSAYTIPLLTPFRLTGSANDPDGDALTYCWEQYDLGPAGSPSSPSGNAPIFRSLEGTADSVRLMPKRSTILAGLNNAAYERLPSYARNMKFRLTVRDNRSGGGGVTYESSLTQLTVVNTVTGFKVTVANSTGVSYPAFSQQLITWDVSSTNIAPINTANVNILLSTDGGITFPVVLASNVPNTGNATVTIPNSQTVTGRIMVEAVGNIYFDINDRNFVIGAPQSLYETGIPGETIQVYPNPVVSDIHWNMTGNFRGAGVAKLTDVAGRLLYTSAFVKKDATIQQVISGNILGSGVYMLTIETEAGSAVSRLVRQ